MKDWMIPEQWQALALELVRAGKPAGLSRKLLTEAASWTLPPKWQSIIVHLGHRARGLDVRANEALRDRHAGQGRCFVIGNGPSLAKTDLLPLKNEITIGANSFYKHPQAADVGVRYLCSGDDSFFVDEPRAVAWHRQIEESCPQATLLFNPRILPLMQKHGLYARHTVHVFENGIKVRQPEHVEFDLCKPLNVGVTTGSLLAIPLAIYLGFKEIILVGFDCNWLESRTNSYHFYQQHELWKEFDSVAADDRDPRYEHELTTALREFVSHDFIARRSRQLGIRICNATIGGVLDTYPRVRYEDLF